jgi:hypothetical protein
MVKGGLPVRYHRLCCDLLLLACACAEGLLGDWSGDRGTAPAVVCLVVLAPLLSFRQASHCSALLTFYTPAPAIVPCMGLPTGPLRLAAWLLDGRSN